MLIGIPKEIQKNERRVAATPATVQELVKLGFSIKVERGAGCAANYLDSAYVEAGAELASAEEAWRADIVLKVRAPIPSTVAGKHELDLMRPNTCLVCFIWPAQSKQLLERLAGAQVSALAMDQVPRITRAQKLDALSSMAGIAGYRATVEAAYHFGRFFTGQITAAGRILPPKVLVIGAGVAGLAAIAGVRRLGAVVRAFDTRAAVKEEVQSLGAEFLELEFEESGEGEGGYAKVMSQAFIDAEMALFREQAKEVDIVITTALVPGKPAPTLWDSGMVESMRPGSVVVDLAAEQGGNCELTQPGKVTIEHDVTIVGLTDLPSRLATTASQLYGTNLVHLMRELGGAEQFSIDLEDQVARSMLVSHGGNVTYPPPKFDRSSARGAPKTSAGAASSNSIGLVAGPSDALAKERRSEQRRSVPDRRTSDANVGRKVIGTWVLGAVGLVLASVWIYLRICLEPGASASADAASFVQHLTVFVLACFVGWQVVWNVTAALHTPLMSVTNAISGIIIIGGLMQGAQGTLSTPVVLGTVAILVAMINVAGGFMVTQRMLRMFRK